jgi:hypothetical protein
MLSLAAILALCREVNLYTGSASPCYGIASLNSRLVQCSAIQRSAAQLMRDITWHGWSVEAPSGP